MTEGAMRIRELCFDYETIPVLRNLNFEISKGEVLVILGPNASGKTTLIKNLCGLLDPTRGEVLLEGRNVARIPRRDAARRIAFVPQEEEVFLPFTVLQIVLMGRAPYVGPWGFETEKDLQATREAMEATDVWRLRDRRLPELSGGERQRALLARAIAQQADFLFLDEPTSHLDIRYQKELLDLCARLNRERGTTLVLSLHDLNLASLYGRRLLFLKEGKTMALGEPQKTLTQEVIRTVFETEASVGRHPKSGLPYYVPIG